MQNRFLIAASKGADVGEPKFPYCNFQLVQAETQQQAIIQYNAKYNCDYFYGTCMAQIVDGKVTILNENITIADLIKYLHVKIVCTAEDITLL